MRSLHCHTCGGLVPDPSDRSNEPAPWGPLDGCRCEPAGTWQFLGHKSSPALAAVRMIDRPRPNQALSGSTYIA